MVKTVMALLLMTAGASAETAESTRNINAKLLRGSGQFGMFRADIEISNPNDFAVKDPRLLCEAFGRSGTGIADFRPTVYEIVPARGKITAKNLQLGLWPAQAVSANCTALSAERQ